MSATSQYPRLGEWLQRWLRLEPHQVIGGPDDPYLLRWYVIPRNPWLNVYVHKFCRSDDDRALHDHPWWFVSLIMKGGYTEVTEKGRTPRSGLIGGRYRAWDRQIAFRPATFRHRVELWPQLVATGRDDQRPVGGPLVRTWREVEMPCWTLIVTGRRSRTWGFWCERWDLSQQVGELKKRFVPWQEWDDATGCGEVS